MIKIKDRLKLEIYETNILGAGVARTEGIVVFVDGAVAGDTVLCEVTKVEKNYAKAKIINIETPSADRIKPECKYFGKCGGCAFCHVSYEHETEAKSKGIYAAFRRFGRSDAEVPTVYTAQRKGYRNKAVFHFGAHFELGYYEEGSNRFIPADKCLLVPDEIHRIRKKVTALLSQSRLMRENDFKYLYIRYLKETNEASVVFGYKGTSSLRPVAEDLAEALPYVKCVMSGKGVDPAKDIFSPVLGGGAIKDVLCDIKMTVSPKSFYQVNHDGAEKLCETVNKFADLKSGDKCIDLYCGIGTFALTLAKKNPESEFYGIEINKKAVEDAIKNAKNNSLDNVKFFAGDSADFREQCNIDNVKCVVVDPPRAGLSPKTIEEIIALSPEKVVYVSCNSSTLARDIKALSERYSIVDTVGVDMFPFTAHVETVVLLGRKDIEGVKIDVYTEDLETNADIIL